MSCTDVDRVAAVADVRRRPDRAALLRHLDGCLPCRERHPELAALLAARPALAVPPRRRMPARPGWRRAGAAAAAAVVMAFAVRALLPSPSPSPSPAPRPPSRAVAGGSRPAHRGMTETVSVRIDRGRCIRSRLTTGTWSPPRPVRPKKEEPK